MWPGLLNGAITNDYHVATNIVALKETASFAVNNVLFT